MAMKEKMELLNWILKTTWRNSNRWLWWNKGNFPMLQAISFSLSLCAKHFAEQIQELLSCLVCSKVVIPYLDTLFSCISFLLRVLGWWINSRIVFHWMGLWGSDHTSKTKKIDKTELPCLSHMNNTSWSMTLQFPYKL